MTFFRGVLLAAVIAVGCALSFAIWLAIIRWAAG